MGPGSWQLPPHAHPAATDFIRDYERSGHYTGFPCLGIEWQRMENPDLRKALLMKVRAHLGGQSEAALDGLQLPTP